HRHGLQKPFHLRDLQAALALLQQTSAG
ncbi:response regulator, partial [Xanthomonas hortorum pv. pelargonii]|nr:response regulator [Xanthomonas hortorum pv. pelargonii]